MVGLTTPKEALNFTELGTLHPHHHLHSNCAPIEM